MPLIEDGSRPSSMAVGGRRTTAPIAAVPAGRGGVGHQRPIGRSYAVICSASIMDTAFRRKPTPSGEVLATALRID